MAQIIKVVGKSNSGKTTLIEKVIPEMKKRGYRVGSVKHSHHGIEIDQPGKDSYRHKMAGADTVVVASPDEFAVLKKAKTDDLDNLEHFFTDVDLVLVEGYKRADRPQVEVFDRKRHEEPYALSSDNGIAGQMFAFVSDDDVVIEGVPLFKRDQVTELCDLIERRYLKK
ncbi:MAG: molybdopterin-guanine dinucleotide biosynthesis protein B [Deltaproteobacteria bacterium]|nr:molybdopterin-guanine dinucleotide biosynthesis protein B [Deltaproteobacteria bacterium]